MIPESIIQFNFSCGIESCVTDCPNSDEHGCSIKPIPLNPLPRGHPNPPIYWNREPEEYDDEEIDRLISIIYYYYTIELARQN